MERAAESSAIGFAAHVDSGQGHVPLPEYTLVFIMHSHSSLTRREFCKRTSMAAAALAASAWPLPVRAGLSANERISIGLIGAGDRASAHVREILALAPKQNVAITAVCDVWRKNREAAVATIGKSSGREPRQFARFQDLLALRDVDAVVIATPDFSHGPVLLAALEAGKDVYIEKPMTIDIASATKALDLARASKRVVQAGTQRRSEGRFISAAQFIATGALGKLNRISAAMNVNQARWARRVDDCHEPDVDWKAFTLGKIKRPFDARLLRCWQLFRDTSNGMPGLWMTHYADAVHFLTGAKYPASAVSLGGNYVWKDGREHADTFHTLLEYPEGFLFDWAMGLGNSAGIHFTLHGTKGTLDAEKWTFAAEGAKTDAPSPIVAAPGVSHMENSLECLRSRARPNADIQCGHQHVVATVLAATALDTGRRQKWDPIKREIFAA
jgi:predicted dehydrogenase